LRPRAGFARFLCHFERVTATDANAEPLKPASALPNVDYRRERPEVVPWQAQALL
jgi:hypothetical protein